MSALDQIDPELRHLVQALREDETSLFWRGGTGTLSANTVDERVRPMSRESATRRAEAHLLDKYREELAAWLLRGVHVAWQRLDPLGDNYVLEEPQPGRLRWDAADLAESVGILERGVGLDPVTGAHAVAELGRLTRDPGLGELLTATNLAARLAPFSECWLFGAQIELALGNPRGAARAAGALDDAALRAFGIRWKRSWMAFAAWRMGQVQTAAEEYDRALAASKEPSATLLASRLLVAIAEGRNGEVERQTRRVEVDTADPERAFRWLGRSVLNEARMEPTGASALLIPTLKQSGPPVLQQVLIDATT